MQNVIAERGLMIAQQGKTRPQLTVKIPSFVEIEASFETDWNRRE
ncbi:hypothetical protein [Rhizobium leguminosarum]|nr:hypothetical protein [Rhizobium leguminosarum]